MNDRLGWVFQHGSITREDRRRSSADTGQLFQFDVRVGEEWRLGQEQMKLENMVITELVNVSFGSWSPVIYVQREPVEIKFTTRLAF